MPPPPPRRSRSRLLLLLLLWLFLRLRLGLLLGLSHLIWDLQSVGRVGLLLPRFFLLFDRDLLLARSRLSSRRDRLWLLPLLLPLLELRLLRLPRLSREDFTSESSLRSDRREVFLLRSRLFSREVSRLSSRFFRRSLRSRSGIDYLPLGNILKPSCNVPLCAPRLELLGDLEPCGSAQ